jgi:hypothetical protein
MLERGDQTKLETLQRFEMSTVPKQHGRCPPKPVGGAMEKAYKSELNVFLISYLISERVTTPYF